MACDLLGSPPAGAHAAGSVGPPCGARDAAEARSGVFCAAPQASRRTVPFAGQLLGVWATCAKRVGAFEQSTVTSTLPVPWPGSSGDARTPAVKLQPGRIVPVEGPQTSTGWLVPVQGGRIVPVEGP